MTEEGIYTFLLSGTHQSTEANELGVALETNLLLQTEPLDSEYFDYLKETEFTNIKEENHRYTFASKQPLDTDIDETPIEFVVAIHLNTKADHQLYDAIRPDGSLNHNSEEFNYQLDIIIDQDISDALTLLGRTEIEYCDGMLPDSLSESYKHYKEMQNVSKTLKNDPATKIQDPSQAGHTSLPPGKKDQHRER